MKQQSSFLTMATLTRQSEFSYQCHGCNRCCHNKLIQVNPFELLHIGQALGLTTTQVIAGFVQSDLPYLKQKPDGSCIFLSTDGCSIHPHRPGVCRVYPLGRLKDEQMQEYFLALEPVPGSQGIFGHEGSVKTFLQSQQADSFFAAGDRCMALQHRLLKAMKNEVELDLPAGFGEHILQWLDVDQILELANCTKEFDNLDERLDRYLAVLDQWFSTPSNLAKGDADENR